MENYKPSMKLLDSSRQAKYSALWMLSHSYNSINWICLLYDISPVLTLLSVLLLDPVLAIARLLGDETHWSAARIVVLNETTKTSSSSSPYMTR